MAVTAAAALAKSRTVSGFGEVVVGPPAAPAAVAKTTQEREQQQQQREQQEQELEKGGRKPERMEIQGLILETPFVSVKAMLTALYPQRWLPYRYLWPFLTNHWDSEEGLRMLAASKDLMGSSTTPYSAADRSPRILILQAGKDELVPATHGIRLEEICRKLGLDVKRSVVAGALHTEVIQKATGKKAVVDFLNNCTKGSFTRA